MSVVLRSILRTTLATYGNRYHGVGCGHDSDDFKKGIAQSTINNKDYSQTDIVQVLFSAGSKLACSCLLQAFG